MRERQERPGAPLAQGGLRRVEDVTNIWRFSGNDFISRDNEFIYATVRKPGTEILTCSLDDAMWLSPQAREAHMRFRPWYKKMDIREKVLLPTGLSLTNMPRERYRVVPPEIIGNMTYVIFLDHISFLFWRKKQALVIRQPTMVETFRAQFKYLWSQGKRL